MLSKNETQSNQNFLLLIELYFLQSKLFILEFNVEDSLNILEDFFLSEIFLEILKERKLNLEA